MFNACFSVNQACKYLAETINAKYRFHTTLVDALVSFQFRGPYLAVWLRASRHFNQPWKLVATKILAILAV